jgi:hypothetical protein
MSAERRYEPVVTLVCTSCQLVYQPVSEDFGSGNTGCPRCGGWTWIAELANARSLMVTDTSQNRPGGHSAKNARRVSAPTTSR